MGKGTSKSRTATPKPTRAYRVETHTEYEIDAEVTIINGKFKGRQGVILDCLDEEDGYGDYAIEAIDGGVEIDQMISSRDLAPLDEDTVREVPSTSSTGQSLPDSKSLEGTSRALESAYTKVKKARDEAEELEPLVGRPSGRGNLVTLTLEELRALADALETGK